MDNKLLVDIEWMDTSSPTLTELSRSLSVDLSSFDLDYGIQKHFNNERIYTVLLPSPVVKNLFEKCHPLLTTTPRPVTPYTEEKCNWLKDQERAAPARNRPVKFTPKI